MSTDQRTKTYVARRTAQRKIKKETMRCLQRFIAREIHLLLTKEHVTISGADLRHQRHHTGRNLRDAARPLNTWPIALSRLERGLTHNNDLATCYQSWLEQAA